MKHLQVALLLLLASAGTLIAQEKGPIEASSASAHPDIVGASPSNRTASVAREYKIGPGDVLNVHVWKEPELSRTVPVRPDGRISMPLVGEVLAEGATVEQLQAKITTEYQKYLNNPEITVIVQEARSQRFNVVGEVQRPGSFVMTQPTTVLDAIAAVGGFRDFAKTKKIYVLRSNGSGTAKRISFNYNKVVRGENSEENIFLQSGDTVVVP